MVKVVESTSATKPMANCEFGENQRKGRSTRPSTALRTTSILDVKRGRGLICRGVAPAGYVVALRRRDRSAQYPVRVVCQFAEATATNFSDHLPRSPRPLFPIPPRHT